MRFTHQEYCWCGEETIPHRNLCKKHHLADKRNRYHSKYKLKNKLSLTEQLREERIKLGL